MTNDKAKIKAFEQMEAWQKAQEIAVVIYKLVKSFPEEEKFGLCNQLRRSSSSISANIAEGFGRKSLKDKCHFYTISYGSLLETKSHLYLAYRLKYMPQEQIKAIIEDIVINQKQLNALIKSIKK